MARLSVTTILFAIASCTEHGQTPPPPSNCGNGVVDLGETCDDGNDRASDGCDQCVVTCGNGEVDVGEECDDGNDMAEDGCHLCRAAVCGNNRFDVGEQCDDGNTIDQDGCTDCVIDEPDFQMLWSFQNIDGTSNDCPPGFPLVDIHVDGEQTGPHLFQFDCTKAFDSVPMLRDRYTVRAVSNDGAGNVYAVSLPQSIDFDFLEVFQTIIFKDAGFFHAAWTLVGEQTGNVLSCSQAGVAKVFFEQSPFNLGDFDCAKGAGFPLLRAGTYTVTLVARKTGGQVVGSSMPTSGTVTVPNGLTDLGTITISVPGL